VLSHLSCRPRHRAPAIAERSSPSGASSPALPASPVELMGESQRIGEVPQASLPGGGRRPSPMPAHAVS